MGTSVVILKDHLRSLVTTLVYGKEQKTGVLARFVTEDPLLKKLQTQSLFDGRTCMSQLDPLHFRVLIALHLSLLDELSMKDRQDQTNPTVRSLDTLFTALLLCLEARTQGTVEMIQVDRVSSTNVLYKLTMSLDDFDFPKPTKKNGLRVIVDNAKA